MMWLLVTGTGRCGTGYICQVLNSVGLGCTHEGVFTLDGWAYALEVVKERRQHPNWNWKADSSWLAVPFLRKPELTALTVVHLVRNPKNVIDSHLRLMLHQKGPGAYHEWMCQHLPELETYDLIDRAACWYVRLNEMIEERADVFHRVEDDVTHLLDKLGIDHTGKTLFDDTAYNTRPGYGPSDVLLEDINQPLRDQVAEMSGRYGYQWPDSLTTVDAGWFDGRTVEICTPSSHVGGAWQLRDDVGTPLCYDAPLVGFFYDKIKDLDNPVVVDVGASTGNFALLGALVPSEWICFEPNPLSARLLKANLAIHDIEAQVYDTALSDRDGEGTLTVPVNAIHAAVACLGDGQFRRDLEVRSAPVEVRRLDSYELPRVDVLKIDVEGAELLVLEGAKATIERDRPGVLLEFTSENTRQFGYEREEIMDWLKVRGYTEFRQVGLEDLWAES